MQNKIVQFVDLHLTPYQEAWDLQEQLMAHTAEVKLGNRNRAEHELEQTANYLLFCEHPHVYTLGKSGDASHLLMQELKKTLRKLTKRNLNHLRKLLVSHKHRLKIIWVVRINKIHLVVWMDKMV
jgi:lipoyl(octanoyl) transferase